MFCPRTEFAVRAFQEARGLHPDGECDETTWNALVEASWRLGDRQLLLTVPNQRGDDVAELQSRLARLGFDCGRVDGILGPRTSRALVDFQSNCGLVADGVCGPETVRGLERVSGQTGDGPGVATVRERERLRSSITSVADCRIVIGQFGGLTAVTRTLARELRQLGATVVSLDEPDAVAQAMAANHFGATVYLGFESRAEPTTIAYFYRVPTFESVGGRSLADALVAELRAAPDGWPSTPEAVGMRLPILRETRMPAVLVALGPPRTVNDAVPTLTAAVLRSLDLWISPSE